jgi:hypothetical protein
VKELHEIRDPVHTFIRVDSDERRVLDSRPVQRLRHVHQLAMTHLVYPGATHKRFEHSLGVMELATRIFDTVTARRNLRHDAVRSIIPEREDQLMYWRKILRMAALCHDVGHLPFSHAAEDELLPEDWDHERLTIELIRSEEMEEIWGSLTPPLRSEHIVKLAVGRKKAGAEFSSWEAILAEIIVGDAFGADRMDYLLRDSLHAGVAYGRFDHHRLIDTLRILPQALEESQEPSLGIEIGGLHSAEALLLARYFMYTQVYFHPVRRIYDDHLKEFLQEWLGGEGLPTAVNGHLGLTDHEVYAAMLRAARDEEEPGHAPARRIVERDHFREVYSRNPRDVERTPDAAVLVALALERRFSDRQVRLDRYQEKAKSSEFPVLSRDRRVVSSAQQSEVLRTLPLIAVDFVFVDPRIREAAEEWLTENRDTIVRSADEKEPGHGTT